MKFSMRESQILVLLQHGLTNKEIAQSLSISPHTVRDHISGMLARHKLPGRAALAVLYHRISEHANPAPTQAGPTSVGLHP